MNRKLIPLFVMLAAIMFCVAAFAEVGKIEGNISGQVICELEYGTVPEYQGSDAVCHNPKHNRLLISKEGEIYHLEPAEGAGDEVMKLIRSEVYEKKKVLIEGEIFKSGLIKVIKVKRFIVEQ